MTNTESRMRELEAKQERIAETLDGADIIGVLMIVWDFTDAGIAFSEWVESSRLALDLIETTQSNPQQAIETLKVWGDLDEEIQNLDETGD